MKRFQTQLILLAMLAVLSIAVSAGCRPSDPDGEARTEPAPVPAAVPAPAPVSPGDAAGLTSDPPPMTSDAAPPAAPLPAGQALRAGFLVVNGVYNTELMAPYDVFQHTKFHSQPGIEVFTVSPDGRPVTTFEGIRITPTYGFQNAPAMDILVVPSAEGSMDRDLQNAALIDWVRRTGGQARHVVSLCDGAFLLAKAGLLNGVPATTFPKDYERFATLFPNVDLRINVSFVDAGKMLTSQGGARSYDVAMHLVDRLYGQRVAKGIGEGLLISWPPDPDTMTPRVVLSTPPAPAPAPTAPAAPAAPGQL
ncbi:MAG TPA: DJ-1/PfpI family protein [Thermoanaerobaculia bacterium]|nr:DJ-1/PfpI family protein [Thermoanaerobaculia bacterium]